MRIVCSLVALLFLAGCGTTTGGFGGGGAVTEVHLFGLPVTVNLDTKPGTDGFAVRVYISRAGSAKGSAVRNGTVEVLMFDGVLGGGDVTIQQPNQIWKFTAAQLNRFEEETSLGHGYRFAMRWNEPPRRGHITVVARYIPPKGQPIYSAPSTINAASK